MLMKKLDSVCTLLVCQWCCSQKCHLSLNMVTHRVCFVLGSKRKKTVNLFIAASLFGGLCDHVTLKNITLRKRNSVLSEAASETPTSLL